VAIAGNLTTITIDSEDLLARVPTLSRALPENQASWAPQITAGRADALEAFHVSKGHDPARAAAVDSGDWERILAFFALAVAYRGMGPEFEERAALWQTQAEGALGRLLYRYDADDSGVLAEDAVDEEMQAAKEIQLER